MTSQRMELTGLDWARYFVPTTICMALAAVCAVLIITSGFMSSAQNAVAVAVAGVFGLLLTTGLGTLFWRAQRRDLQYTRMSTTADSDSNFAAVLRAANKAGWRIVRAEAPARLDAAAATVSLLDAGERIAVKFQEHDVLVACICDPSVGFSLVGRRHCAEHRELVRQAVSGEAARAAA